MKNPSIAAMLNFFLMRPGTLYDGRRKAFGLALTINQSAKSAQKCETAPYSLAVCGKPKRVTSAGLTKVVISASCSPSTANT